MVTVDTVTDFQGLDPDPFIRLGQANNFLAAFDKTQHACTMEPRGLRNRIALRLLSQFSIRAPDRTSLVRPLVRNRFSGSRLRSGCGSGSTGLIVEQSGGNLASLRQVFDDSSVRHATQDVKGVQRVADGA